jgi:phosphopantothenoylcysteine decarboxylase / phosphopantothenate---cysteine ligase
VLRKKKILLGVCGSIAAYKAAFLVRILIKEEAEVQVVMTASASEFISGLTLSTLSKRPAPSEFIKDETGQWNNHVELALWADLIVIAPASANTIAKFAYGLCDNLLSAVYLSAKCPVYIAPAMDLDMYKHKTTINNLEKLRSCGNRIIEAEFGELASGLKGSGRMAEPEKILKIIKDHFSDSEKLKGKKILITAGPTYEKIDPVRFIGNFSSGKMGYEIAEAFVALGAQVQLVSGPTHLPTPGNIQLSQVNSAREMYDEVQKYFQESDITVLAAAVADYTPKYTADKKIKKKEDSFNLELVKTVDIASELGKKKKNDQIIIGFALETDNEIENAKGKLVSKKLDLIILNSMNDKGAGFAKDTNKITIIDKDNNISNFELKSKKEVASDIVQTIMNYLHV